MGIVIPINLSGSATYEQFAACIPEVITLRLKKRSFLFDAGRVPICNAIIIPETMLDGVGELIGYKRCRISRFYGVERKRSSTVCGDVNKISVRRLTEDALRAKGGDCYMYWRSTGYGYKVRRARSKFPNPLSYENEEERDRKNPYVSLLLPEVGNGTVEMYITSRRSAERKINRMEVDGFIISRTKGMKILNEYNEAVDEAARRELREKTVRLSVK